MNDDRIRVVLVDDNRTVLMATRWLLEDDGRFVVVADLQRAETVLAHCQEADLVVVDIAMPGTDGLSLLDEIRWQHPSLPVVVFTGYAQPYLRDEALRRGAADFVEKMPDMVEVVERFVAAARPAPPPDESADDDEASTAEDERDPPAALLAGVTSR